MGARNMLQPVLGLLLVVNVVTAIQWTYEFGQKVPMDAPIYEKDGNIGLFSYRNSYKIEVPLGMELTHVVVTVWSVSPPKVDLNKSTNTVEIVYSWSQITLSSFKIKADGVVVYPPLPKSAAEDKSGKPVPVPRITENKKAKAWLI